MATPLTGVSLLSLPDELLRLVFSGIVLSSHCARLTRVCRRLLPFARERLYESPYLFTLRSHKLLARTFEASPDLQDLVKRMSVSESYYVEVADNDDPTRRHGKRVPLAPEALYKSLRLPACESLAVRELESSTLQGMFGASSASALSRVKVLSLSMRSRRSDPDARIDTDAGWWGDLVRLPALEELRLDGGILASPGPEPRFASVRRLTLGTDLIPPFNTPLADTFPELRHLTMSSLDDFDFVEHVLSTSPLDLETIVARGEFIDCLAEYLPRFPLLARLELGTPLGSESLLPTLASSRIRHIRLGFGCTGADDFLAGILRGATCMRSLCELCLGHVVTLAGDNLFEGLWEENFSCSPHEAVASKSELMASYYPDWPDGSSAEGLSRALELAREAGVNVSGSALECLDWERDFEEQFKRFLVQKSIDSDDFGALERHYGREEAGEAIVRFHPDLADLVLEAARRKEEKRMAEA